MDFPKHEAGLYLVHNEHRGYYQRLEEWLEDMNARPDEWAAPDQREKALATDSCWRLQWYPHTPVGFNVLYAADLDVLLAAAADA